MRAAVFTRHREPLEVREVTDPDRDPHGIVVETEACGICRSDWHAWQGDPLWQAADFEEGHIFGHEPVGIVDHVGDQVETIREGDRVAVPFNLGDGVCPYCRNGHANLCDNGIALGLVPDSQGAFAERFHVPWADFNVVQLPEDVTSVEMAGLGCRFMTAFHTLAHRADVAPGDWVAVHGCGGIGLSAVHIADALGTNVIAVDIFDDKLAFAEDLGAVETINGDEVDSVPREIKTITDGGAEISIDALGIAETCRNSIKGLRKLGQHLQIGLSSSEEGGEIDLPTDIMVTRELQFIGSYGMPPARYDEIFRMIEHGKLDPESLVTNTVPLDETPEVLASMTEFETVGFPVIDEF